jgi:hypothetical protein
MCVALVFLPQDLVFVNNKKCLESGGFGNKKKKNYIK